MIGAEESAQNYFKYKSRIDELCKESGKWETGVELLCATKTVSGERINEIRSLTGLDLIGENRVQELLEKYDVLDKEGLRIHFIGKLQSNKVKYIIDKVDMIESLDSLSLAAEIDRQARKHGIVMDVLVEINIGREKEKSGIMPEETEKFLRALAEYPAIRVRGLMTVAPRCDTRQERIGYFEQTHKIFIDISKMELHNIDMSYLSMGMTQSYEEGILCGANIVRVGSGIFGERDYVQKEKSE